MGKSKRLDIKDQEYIAKLRKSGKKFRDICNLTGFSLGAVTNAVDKFNVDVQQVKDLQDRQKQEIEERSIKAVADFIPSDKVQAIDVHRRVMSMVDEKPQIALDAANKTLDRIDGKPIQKTINENINANIPNDAVRKMLKDKGFNFVLENL